MPVEYYYDTRDFSATNVAQFFHEARMTRPNKEVDTNMPLAGTLGKTVKLKRIIVQLPAQALSSTTAADMGAFDDIAALINEGIIELQIGTKSVHYYPLSLGLGQAGLSAGVHYTQATAANATYAIGGASATNGELGIKVEEEWGREETIKFFIRTATAVTVSKVRAILEVEV